MKCLICGHIFECEGKVTCKEYRGENNCLCNHCLKRAHKRENNGRTLVLEGNCKEIEGFIFR